MGTEKFIFALWLLLCGAAAVWFYRDELMPLLPWEFIAEKRRSLEKELVKLEAKRKSGRLDRELYSGSITLKNLALMRRDSPFSADFMYERLMENSSGLRPIYGEMLTLYRAGKDKEAFNVLAVSVGTKPAKAFAGILSKLDRINPAELAEQMDAFQEMMTENETTAAMKKAQRNSLIITAFSVTSVFILLINFAVVVVFTDTINLLNTMFL